MDQTEVGRIFSCLALVSALVQFVSGPMYAVIYNQTLDTFPGTFMLTTSLIIFVAMVITVLVKRLMSKGQLMKYCQSSKKHYYLFLHQPHKRRKNVKMMKTMNCSQRSPSAKVKKVNMSLKSVHVEDVNKNVIYKRHIISTIYL